MIFGMALTSVATDLLVMVGFGMVMLLIAIPAFNRAMTRQGSIKYDCLANDAEEAGWLDSTRCSNMTQ
jgi:hypothetical protein